MAKFSRRSFLFAYFPKTLTEHIENLRLNCPRAYKNDCNSMCGCCGNCFFGVCVGYRRREEHLFRM